MNYQIKPGKLQGKVRISGSKNASIPIILSSLLVQGKVTLSNVPNVGDVKEAIRLVISAGSNVSWNDKILEITPPKKLPIGGKGIQGHLRSSLLLLGIYFANKMDVTISRPGGCAFGPRPIDIHKEVFESLGAYVNETSSTLELNINKLIPTCTKLELKVPSVTATMNAVLASLNSTNNITIENCAKDPEVVDLCRFLNKCGALITGEGSNTLRVTGVTTLDGCDYSIIPDRIEAATYMIAAAVTRSIITLENCEPHHLGAIIDLLEEIGATITIKENLTIECTSQLKAFSTSTEFYPGLPTDIQPILTVLGLTIGNCSVEEKIYRNRMSHLEGLEKLKGIFKTTKSANHTITMSKSGLVGGKVVATDLRAGAALIVAGLIASGKTTIMQSEQIDRGYEQIIEKLSRLHVDISK